MIPRLGITLGDPAGIGAEVILKAVTDSGLAPAFEPLVIGDLESLRETAGRLRIRCDLVPIGEAELAARIARRETRPVVRVLAGQALSARARRPGRPTLEGGAAAYRYIETAVRLARASTIAAIVTAPINKASVARAGHPISGHTELLQQLTGAREVRMMLVGERLKVVLVTTHLALGAVPAALTTRAITRTIVIAHEHLRRYHRLSHPRLAVAGLNPHAGEHGLFGSEESMIIAPAIRRACQAGAPASGPHPADSLFFRAAAGEFDAVISMYHDQGLIPLKLLHFHDAVNVTLGLPVVRTSPDHGTAYDIAGRGTADAGSMKAALALAARMARRAAGGAAAPSTRAMAHRADQSSPRSSRRPAALARRRHTR